MIKQISILVLLILLANSGIALGQSQTNFWPLAGNMGIDFSSNRFAPVTGTNTFLGNTSAICNRLTGQLLFYTDGRKVWDSRYRQMPNGSGLRGGIFTPQAVLVVPAPQHPGKYYIFTTKAFSDTLTYFTEDSRYTGLYYTMVDMSLNNGHGDVIAEKNKLLMARSTEKLTAVPHTNGSDFWLISHEHATNRFVVFSVTSGGVGDPVYFETGHVNTSYQEQGWLAPSPDGTMLACAPGAEGVSAPLELYDFDAEVGAISNLRQLGSFRSTSGVCFSPDNSKLYLAYADETANGNTVQFDLSGGDTADIIASATPLHFVFPTGIGSSDTLAGSRMQIAPDGRIYTEFSLEVVREESDRLQRSRIILLINQPNAPGLACEPTYREFNATPSMNLNIGIGIPNFMPAYFNILEPTDNSFVLEECQKLIPAIYPIPTSSTLAVEFANSNCVYPVRVSIFNLAGQQLLGRTLYYEASSQIDLSAYPAGVYILMLQTPFTQTSRRIIRD